jgi:hypothetical protein
MKNYINTEMYAQRSQKRERLNVRKVFKLKKINRRELI